MACVAETETGNGDNDILGTPNDKPLPTKTHIVKHAVASVNKGAPVTRSHCKQSAPGGGVSSDCWGEIRVMSSNKEVRFVVPLIKANYLFGRSSNCDIRISLPQCSRQHLTLAEKRIHDSKVEGGLRRIAYLNRIASVWKTKVTDNEGNVLILDEKVNRVQLRDLHTFELCGKPFQLRLCPVGIHLSDLKNKDHEQENITVDMGAIESKGRVADLSIEGRPATVAHNKSSRKRKRRLRTEVNDSSIISDSLIQSPLQGTPKDLKSDLFTNKSFENGGSFQGSFLLDNSEAGRGRASIIRPEDDLSIEGTASPMHMPSPEQQPSAMKSQVPQSLTRVKSVRFGAFNEQAYIDPLSGSCSVTPATKLLSTSAKKRMIEEIPCGLQPSPLIHSTPILGLGLMRSPLTGNERRPCRLGENDPLLLTAITDVMKMPKARKPPTLLRKLDHIRELVVDLTKKARSMDTHPSDVQKAAFGFMRALNTLPYEHPVMATVKELLKETTMITSVPNKRTSKRFETLWDGLQYLKQNPGDVSALRLDIVSCIVKLVRSSPDDSKLKETAVEECYAMFNRLAEMTNTDPKNIPELAGKRLRQGLKRLVSLEHHKAEKIIISLCQKLGVSDRRNLAEAAEKSIRMGLMQLRRHPADLALLSPEHRNMTISSLSELLTIGSASLTALLTSTAKELNSFGGHTDTTNAILVGVSHIMAQPQTIKKDMSQVPRSLDFSSQHASFLEGDQESTIIGKSAFTPSSDVRKHRKGDATPHPSKKKKLTRI